MELAFQNKFSTKEISYNFTIKFLLFFLFFLVSIPDFFSFIPQYGFYIKPFIIFAVFLLYIKGKDKTLFYKFKNLKIVIFLLIYEVICEFLYYKQAGFGFGSIIQSFLVFLYPFLFAGVVVIYLKNYNDLKQLTYILMIPIIIQMIFGLIQLFAGYNEIVLKIVPQILKEGVAETHFSSRNILGEMMGSGSRGLHIMGTFAHFNRYGYFLLFAPLVFFSQSDTSLSRSGKIYFLILFILSLVCLYFSFSRGALLGILIFIIIYFFKYKIESRSKVIIIYLILLTSFFIFQIVFNVFIEYYYRTENVIGRIMIWDYYIDYLKDFQFMKILFGTHTYLLDVENQLWMGSHNSYLMIIYDKGLVGLILYIILAIKVARTKYDNHDTGSNYLIFVALKYTFFAFLFSQIVDHKLFANTLHRTYLFTYAAIILTSSKFLNNRSQKNKIIS